MAARRVTSLLTALGLAACATSRAITIDPACADPDHAEIRRAIRQWNDILREPLREDLLATSWLVTRSPPPDPRFTSQTSHATHVIYIAPDAGREYTYALILHELGHVVGLRHIQGVGVMNPSVRADQTYFTPADLEECRRVGACALTSVEREQTSR